MITPNPLATAGSAIAAEIAVPPTGFITGIYARNDEQNGVSKAPANEVMLGASRLERDISFAEQGILNPAGNQLPALFPEPRISGMGRAHGQLRSGISVRQCAPLPDLSRALHRSTARNGRCSRITAGAVVAGSKKSIDSFLYNEYVQEATYWVTAPSQAYFVRCDRTTMTQNDLDNGRMICLIGVALLKPAEFVIFRIGQITALGSELVSIQYRYRRIEMPDRTAPYRAYNYLVDLKRSAQVRTSCWAASRMSRD